MSKRFSQKKLLSMLTAFAMTIAVTAGVPGAATVYAADAAADLQTAVLADGAATDLVAFINTNDVHGSDNANLKTAGVAQLKKDLEALGVDTLLVSAGDAIQGTPLVNVEKGKNAIDFMSAAGYDAMVPGNHEFDWGTENLLSILANADFDVLSADLLQNGELLFTPNKIYELNGVQVGVFGLTTPEAYTKTNPANIVGLTIPQGQELYDIAQAQVDELTAAGAELVICIGHLGVDTASAPNQSTDLIANVNGIDLFVDGHSHTKIAGNEVTQANGTDSTLVVSAGTQLQWIGLTTYNKTTGALSSHLVAPASYEGEDAILYDGVDAAIDTLISGLDTEITDALKADVIGATEVVLYGKNTEEPAGVRVAETNLGDLAADAILWQARQTLGEGAVDLALTNGGGIRDSIPVLGGTASADALYDITMFDAFTVFPFGNTVATIKITGAQLLEALEAGTFSSPAVLGAFPQVAGVEFEINTGVEYAQGAQYEGSTYFAPANPGSRVLNVTVGGEPLDLTATYTVATNDFTAAGGDTYSVFKETTQFTNTGVGLDAALSNYIASLGGTITADSDYAEPQGRIAYVSSTPTVPVDSGTALTMSFRMGDMTYALNGATKNFDTLPFIDSSNYTLVPLRAISEGLGAEVAWDDATNTVTINMDGKELALTIGVLVEGMDTPAIIINNFTMVPIRYISEGLGATVGWDNATKTITITK